MNENLLLVYKLLSLISDPESEKRKLAEQELNLIKKKSQIS